MNATELIRELVAIPGPPGQEEAVRAAVEAHVRTLDYACSVDAKGNLLVPLPGASSEKVSVVVTAHLDEIGLMVSGVERDGTLRVVPLGGLYPWKWGEQPVEILASGEPLPGILSFGCIHTNSPLSTAQQARSGPLGWEQAFVFTGLLREELLAEGVRPGTRLALARERRGVREFGEYVASYFLDDRADLAAWLLALESLRGETFSSGVIFAATVAEEVGGEGALYLLNRLQPDVCIALEIGPSVPESRFLPDEEPTIWVNDSFAAIAARDIQMLQEVCAEIERRPHWQALSRGGSDASCAAARGVTARPLTFGLAIENSHGFEIMHRDAPANLAQLTVACLKRLQNGR